MKKVKMLFKTINYLGAKTGTTLRTSLAHTLRVEDIGTQNRLEHMKWDPDMVATNQIWVGNSFATQELRIPSNQLLDFGTFISSGMNTQLINSIVGHYQQPANKAQLNKTLANAKFALKKAFKQVEQIGSDDTKAIFKSFIRDGSDFEKLKTFFAELPQDFRPKKLVKKLEYFHSRRNIHKKYPSRKSTVVQEGIFTFPVKDPITVGFAELENELAPKELMFAIKSFLEKFFSEYPIIAIVSHVDEVRLHVHYFIDGWSTGLLPRTIPQKTFGTFMPTDAEIPSDKAVLNKYDLKRAGSILQTCFYDHINEVLLNKKGIHAEISPIEERNSAEARHRNLDAKKPIATREYQRVNEQIRQLKIQQEALNKSNEELQLSMATLVQQSAKFREVLVENANTILEQQKTIDVLNGESLSEFVDALKEAFKSASSYTFTTDLEVKVALLLKRYPLLQRDFWQEILRVGLGANPINYNGNDKVTNNN